MLQQVDTAIFRLINQMGNPWLDPIVTFFNGGQAFKILAFIAGILILWKGARRARVCCLFVALALVIGDGIICSSIKKAVGRQRPYQQFTDTRTPAGRGNSGSMPSSHAANMAAACVIVVFFYRRAKWLGVFMTFMVALARVYSGVHFPSDVLAGATLAAAYSLGLLFGAEALWRRYAPALMPNVSERLPSLLHPEQGETIQPAPREIAWFKLGWLLIAAMLIFRLLYLASGKIELSEDEAYQWLWSKHLALSYYSKPPLIAYVQFLGTHIWGDTQFGVRFFAPILGAITAAAAMVLVRREASARAAFFIVASAIATPILAAGSTLMTIDALSVMFWTVAMALIWRAIKEDSTRLWALAGVAIAFGNLAKYVALLQWICVFLFLSLHTPARRQFARPGLYLAIFISLLGLIPVAIWNQQNGWITLTHLNERSGLHQAWSFNYRFLTDFTAAQLGLLNPVFLTIVIIAAIRFWKNRTPFQTFLFCMGAPLFLGYFAYTIRARVQPNWVAPSVLPLFALAATYWEPRWNDIRDRLKPALITGFSLGFTLVVLMHDTNLTAKIFGFNMPIAIDPLMRLRGWSTLGSTVDAERKKFAAENPFIIGDHYGVTSLMTFYIPEARKSATSENFIYVLATEHPRNQFYFWPNYLHRTGENALFVARAKMELPAELKSQFKSIDYIGERQIAYRGRLMNSVHLYLCHELKPQAAH